MLTFGLRVGRWVRGGGVVGGGLDYVFELVRD